MREIRTADVEDFAALPCLELALAQSIRGALLKILRNLFRWAERWEDIDHAPAVPSVDIPEKEIPWLMPEEQAAVLDQIPQEIGAARLFRNPDARPELALLKAKRDRKSGRGHRLDTVF